MLSQEMAPLLLTLALAFTPIHVERGPSGGVIWRARIPGARRASLIYLPPGYSAARRYPAIYLLAGMPGSPWAYVKSLSLASVADTLISTRRVRPFVAVMPPAGPSGRYSGEWAGPWEDYLVRRVVPWVQATSRSPATERSPGSRQAGSGRSASRSATRDSSGAWSPGAAGKRGAWERQLVDGLRWAFAPE